VHTSVGDISFQTAPSGSANGAITWTSRLHIENTGNVGIGTSSPGSKLEVYNSATAGNTQLHIHNDKTGDAAVLRLEGARTSVNDAGQINFANGGSIGAAIRMYSGGSDEGELRFFTSTTGTGDVTQERIRIQGTGNVGIGETNPTAKLHVNGDLLTNDLILTNMDREAGPNEVDGTRGHWCIQEGEEDLFLINRNSGKKYKFNITEVIE